MKNDFEMYSNDVLAENLQTLIINRNIPLTEICDTINNEWGVTFSFKQMQKYVRGTTNQRIGSDKLYAFAQYFGVSMDALVTKNVFDEEYIKIGNPNLNKLNLNVNSRQKLIDMKSETEINVINKIIDSNLIETFTKQLESAVAQIKTATDNETKEDVTYLASCMLQREIDKLFRKCVKEYIKK